MFHMSRFYWFVWIYSSLIAVLGSYFELLPFGVSLIFAFIPYIVGVLELLETPSCEA